jgi:hypothetical protein
VPGGSTTHLVFVTGRAAGGVVQNAPYVQPVDGSGLRAVRVVAPSGRVGWTAVDAVGVAAAEAFLGEEILSGSVERRRGRVDITPHIANVARALEPIRDLRSGNPTPARACCESASQREHVATDRFAHRPMVAARPDAL